MKEIEKGTKIRKEEKERERERERKRKIVK